MSDVDSKMLEPHFNTGFEVRSEISIIAEKR